MGGADIAARAGPRATAAAWCRFSQRNRPRRLPCAMLFRSRVSPEHRAPRASGLSRISRDEVFFAPHLTRTSVRSPAAHRRTRHLSGISHICQALLTGDNVRPAHIIHPAASCPHRLVRLGVLCEKPCRDWVCGKSRKSVVHRYSQQVHRLSTDLSFVDNFRPGVQSRSNNESHPVSGLRQEPGGRPSRGRHQTRVAPVKHLTITMQDFWHAASAQLE